MPATSNSQRKSMSLPQSQLFPRSNEHVEDAQLVMPALLPSKNGIHSDSIMWVLDVASVDYYVFGRVVTTL